MEINNATFIISNAKLSGCPQDGLSEYAFIGRSNVGKSSLINMLTGVKDLAKTSSKPGKTLLINHFLINQSWYIVDLPGYGFAKIGKKMREELHKLVTDYVLKREQLACLFVLIDSRHEAQQIDLDFLEFLGENEIPFAIVFTKTDKITQAELGSNIRKFKESLLETWEELPVMFQTSSEKNRGGKEILQYIENINASSTSEKSE
ncbi:MAG: ribosome biogenesis GTP-binding protein YihA/YsxC [Bacteroidales bacterium]|nr:ribosome biogenesis GTP-binding protein YihA/YsxC [Bacteroidales bacterium]MDD3906601.1 ribosome biogenesis GTP-binding protein YihA/YsxC [Bacteroidales bacterium]MDD4712411.1 ribosome biogenesis GTP-binding protein YihA/YsxC [Bacteroidales bacterium]